MLDHYLTFITYNWITVIISLVAIMFLLNFATWKLEEQLSVIWKKLKISSSVRGATFDAVSSSLPELLTWLAWLLILKEKWLEVWIWTIWGSAIFNILIIPALVILFYKWKKIRVYLWGIKRDTGFYVLAVLIFILWLYFNQLLIMSILLVLLYAFYIGFLYFESLKHKKENLQETEKNYEEVKNIKINYLIILVSLVLTYLWVEAAVVAASFIAEQLNISVLIVSLVLLAGITSIPDTLLSVKSSMRWDIDAWLSNAIWSNIFDICIWLWVPILIWLTIMNLKLQVNFNDNVGVFAFLIITTIIYFALLSRKNISKTTGYLLLLIYWIFILYLIYIS